MYRQARLVLSRSFVARVALKKKMNRLDPTSGNAQSSTYSRESWTIGYDTQSIPPDIILYYIIYNLQYYYACNN